MPDASNSGVSLLNHCRSGRKQRLSARPSTGQRARDTLCRSRGKRTLVHGVIVLCRFQLLLISAPSTPPAIWTKHNILRFFHVALRLLNDEPSQQRAQSPFLIIDIGKSYRHARSFTTHCSSMQTSQHQHHDCYNLQERCLSTPPTCTSNPDWPGSSDGRAQP